MDNEEILNELLSICEFIKDNRNKMIYAPSGEKYLMINTSYVELLQKIQNKIAMLGMKIEDKL